MKFFTLLKNKNYKMLPAIPSPTVEIIHKEFESMSEKILKDAKEIIARNKSYTENDRKELDRLLKLGFESEKTVKTFLEDSNKLLEAKNISELIEYYNKNYKYKFISKNCLNEIEIKYGIEVRTASSYIGKIPDKNRKEILEFEFDDDEHSYYFRYNFGYGFPVPYEEYLEYKKMEYKKRPVKKRASELKDSNIRIAKVDKKTDFLIAANAKFFGGESSSPYNDPVALYPVKGGYLIVSMWEENGTI